MIRQDENLTDAIEDYLKAIYQLAEEQGYVSNTTLAAYLGVAPASITGMLRKLATKELVQYEPYHHVSLTVSGQRKALRVVRYHRLAERYLSEVLGLPWDQVHEEADRWEHVISETVAGRMDAAMGHPATDPHGEPIPDADGAIDVRSEERLAALASGQTARITHVGSRDAALLRYLGTMGFYPMTEVTVLEVAPFEGPLTVAVGDERRVIGRQAAGQVYVSDVRKAE